MERRGRVRGASKGELKSKEEDHRSDIVIG